MALGPGHRDAPVDGGAGDGNVPQAAPDDPQGFVAVALGGDVLGVGLEPLQERLLELGEHEEVVLLGHPLHPARLDVFFGYILF